MGSTHLVHNMRAPLRGAIKSIKDIQQKVSVNKGDIFDAIRGQRGGRIPSYVAS